MEKGTVNKNSNVKRRLSDEREESNSSRIRLANSYNLLNDEMALESSDTSITKKSIKDKPIVLAGPVVQAGTSVLASTLLQAGTSVPVSTLVGAGTSVSGGLLAQPETSVSGCAPVHPGTPHSVCAPVQAEKCVSGCALVRTGAVASDSASVSDCTMDRVETCVLNSAVDQSETISSCVPARDGASSLTRSHELVSEDNQSKNSSQEMVESSCSEQDDVLPSIDIEPAPEKLGASKKGTTGTIPKSTAITLQAQRAHGNAHRRIRVPNKNIKGSEKKEKLKHPGVVKTKVSSK